MATIVSQAADALKRSIKPPVKPAAPSVPAAVGATQGMGPAGSKYPDLPTSAGVAPTAPRTPVSSGTGSGGPVSDAKLQDMEARIGAAPARRIGGGKRAKPGATYRSGEFKGKTEGQAWAGMMAEGENGPSKYRGLDAYHARQGTSLADDLGLTGGSRVPSSAAMVPGARENAVREFSNSPGVVARQRYEATQPVPSTPSVFAATKPPAKSAGAWQGPPAPPQTAAIEAALGKADRAKTMAADVLRRTATPGGAAAASAFAGTPTSVPAAPSVAAVTPQKPKK